MGIQLKGIEEFEAHRAYTIPAECPAVLAPESAQPRPICARPRHRLVAGSHEGRIEA